MAPAQGKNAAFMLRLLDVLERKDNTPLQEWERALLKGTEIAPYCESCSRTTGTNLRKLVSNGRRAVKLHMARIIFDGIIAAQASEEGLTQEKAEEIFSGAVKAGDKARAMVLDALRRQRESGKWTGIDDGMRAPPSTVSDFRRELSLSIVNAKSNLKRALDPSGASDEEGQPRCIDQPAIARPATGAVTVVQARRTVDAMPLVSVNRDKAQIVEAVPAKGGFVQATVMRDRELVDRRGSSWFACFVCKRLFETQQELEFHTIRDHPKAAGAVVEVPARVYGEGHSPTMGARLRPVSMGARSLGMQGRCSWDGPLDYAGYPGPMDRERDLVGDPYDPRHGPHGGGSRGPYAGRGGGSGNYDLPPGMGPIDDSPCGCPYCAGPTSMPSSFTDHYGDYPRGASARGEPYGGASSYASRFHCVGPEARHMAHGPRYAVPSSAGPIHGDRPVRTAYALH
mmetsp:Transcript_28129/g.82660  ORF Transcript_28129/g.82660 Transcript_28129/m.82660 type:complete len:455 (-) Transcript_28129:413-1777(-)